MSMFPDTMQELKAEYLKERMAYDKSLQRELVLEAQLAFLRKRIEQIVEGYEFADGEVKHRHVVAQLRAILAETP